MKRILVLCLLLGFTTIAINAQEELDGESDLVVVGAEIFTETDIFGTEGQVVMGSLFNNSTQAYSNVSIYVDGYSADNEILGEGFGYLTNACGEALLDFALQPGEGVSFVAPFESFTEGIVSEFVFSVDYTTLEPEQLDVSQAYIGLSIVTQAEVVQVEWIDENTLRYGVGCATDVFTELEWHEYKLDSRQSTEIVHPRAELVTETFLQQTGLNRLTQSGDANEFVYPNSQLRFPPSSLRVVYQNDIHTIISAEFDGSFRRLIQDRMHRHSLKGFIFYPRGVFLGYYYGAYGDPVRYLTANLQGQLLSAPIDDVLPSVTIPGATSDGLHVVISGEFEEGLGYYLKSVTFPENTFLFSVDELPGNNYPAPVYYKKDDQTRYIYLVRPVLGQARLQCFNRETETLETLTAIPLDLDTNERAWSWVSPDYRYLALSANGNNGGLWIVDLQTFSVCQ